MKKIAFASLMFPLLSSLLVSCSYDPEPDGCEFRIESTSGASIGGLSIGYKDTLTVQETELVVEALTSGTCPAVLIVNVAMRNNGSPGSVVVEELQWSATGNMGGSTEYLCSGNSLYPVNVPAGETRYIAMELSFNAAALYGDYTAEEIIAFFLAVGGHDRIIRDAEHLGRLSLETIFTEDTPHGRIESRGPFTLNLDWIQP